MKAKQIVALKAKMADAIMNAAGGLTRKQVAYAVGLPPSNRDVAAALDSLVAGKTVARSGAVGAGYRYRVSTEEVCGECKA